MPTLVQYWTDELARIDAALTNAEARLDAIRIEVMDGEQEQRDTAELVADRNDALAAARAALASIPMPADGDPLLAAMQAELVGLNEARAALATGQRTLLSLRAELERLEAARDRLASERALAESTLANEEQAATARQEIVDRFAAGGALEALIPDAQTALDDHQATATSRVEGELPTNADDARSLLVRVRARAQLVQDIVAGAQGVEQAAYAGEQSALAVAQRAFDAAVQALLTVGEFAPVARADIATLARLAALPAPSPPDSFPILTRWQHELLHDSTSQTDREDTLAALTAVDLARAAVIPVQSAYEQALHAAMQTEPDATIDALNTGTVATEKAALDQAMADLEQARADYEALDAANRQLLDEWLAAVPDTLWTELTALDGAVARLEALTGGPSPTDLLTAVGAAETTLEAELRAAREAERSVRGGATAADWAAVELRAERDTAAARAVAMSHSSVLF